jgi:zinc protease
MKRTTCISVYAVAFLLLSIVVGFWAHSRKFTIEEPRNIAFQEHTLDIKEIKIPSLEKPIWFVKTKNPTVAIFICFRNEGARNFKEKPGILTLLFRLIEQGAGPYGTTELKQVSDANSLNISIGANIDDSYLSTYIVPEKFQLAMDLLQEHLINAHLPEDKIAMYVQEIKERVTQGLVYPENIADDEMMKLLYHPDHLYFITDNDVLNNIDKYTRDDLVAVYNKLFVPRNAFVIVAGNISEGEVKEAFEKLFTALRKHKSNSFEKVEQDTKLFKKGEIVHLKYDTPQTIVLFSHPGIKSDTKERYAFIIANEILGVGGAARLFYELREKLGLVYAISSDVICQDMLSYVAGSACTDPKNRDMLIGKVKDIFRELAEHGIIQEELDSQKIAIAVSCDLSSAPKIVAFLGKCRRLGIPFNAVNHYSHNFYDLTLEEVNGVIKEAFDADKLNFVTIGPEQ